MGPCRPGVLLGEGREVAHVVRQDCAAGDDRRGENRVVVAPLESHLDRVHGVAATSAESLGKLKRDVFVEKEAERSHGQRPVPSA